MLYYNWILNIDDKKLHENTAEASEYIIYQGLNDDLFLRVKELLRPTAIKIDRRIRSATPKG
jgi:hypothetical protein